jgi:hypothetical protein
MILWNSCSCLYKLLKLWCTISNIYRTQKFIEMVTKEKKLSTLVACRSSTTRSSSFLKQSIDGCWPHVPHGGTAATTFLYQLKKPNRNCRCGINNLHAEPISLRRAPGLGQRSIGQILNRDSPCNGLFVEQFYHGTYNGRLCIWED